jgi:hypothetical protein
MSDSASIYDDKADVRSQLDLTHAEWQRPGTSESLNGCPEIALVPHSDGVTYVAMRNSADPEGTILVFTPGEWDAFIAGAKDGEFDEPWDNA